MTTPIARGWLGSGRFERGVEQALGVEPRAQAQEALVQRAGAGVLHRLGDELQLAARLVDREPPAQLDALAVGGRERRAARRRGGTWRSAARRCRPGP